MVLRMLWLEFILSYVHIKSKIINFHHLLVIFMLKQFRGRLLYHLWFSEEQRTHLYLHERCSKRFRMAVRLHLLLGISTDRYKQGQVSSSATKLFYLFKGCKFILMFHNSHQMSWKSCNYWQISHANSDVLIQLIENCFFCPGSRSYAVVVTLNSHGKWQKLDFHRSEASFFPSRPFTI